MIVTLNVDYYSIKLRNTQDISKDQPWLSLWGIHQRHLTRNMKHFEHGWHHQLDGDPHGRKTKKGDTYYLR